jgi:hydroxyacylglutathione hydrolase
VMGAEDVPPDVHLIVDEALGNTSYFVSAGDGVAFSVDPRRDVDEHVALAERLGVRIVAVIETHLHADFVSGAPELRDATGATIHGAALARLDFPHSPITAGERIQVGGVAVEALATPGHTPEHLAFLATIGGIGVLFSGGSLIVGGAARTDLSGAERTTELAWAQHASVRRLASLPTETVLCPTHGGGSFCSTGRAKATTSTIGRELETNPLLRAPDADAFVEQLSAGLGSYPTYFNHLRDVNRLGPERIGDLDAVPRLPADQAWGLMERGAWLVDARPVPAWAEAHPQGAVSIELRPAFASWLGWVVPFGADVVLLLEGSHLREALRLARRVGYDAIRGWITFEDWRDAGLAVASVESVGAREAAERAAHGTTLLDVRQRSEHAAARLRGSTSMELGDIIAGKTPDAEDVITYCGHGERSATAASLLERRGLRVANLDGGTSAWRDAGLPLER